MIDLTGKIALITGGTSGIGYTTAGVLKKLGADVTVTGRNREALDKVASELGVHAIFADQAKVSDLESLATQVKSRHGGIDILFIKCGFHLIS